MTGCKVLHPLLPVRLKDNPQGNLDDFLKERISEFESDDLEGEVSAKNFVLWTAKPVGMVARIKRRKAGSVFRWVSSHVSV